MEKQTPFSEVCRLSTSNIDRAKGELDKALERLKTVQTGVELEQVRQEVDRARDNLLKVSDSFRQSTQRNMESMRSQAMSGMPMGAMGGMGMGAIGMGAMVPLGGVSRPSISIDGETVWACRRCGSKNVNWKGLGGRKRQRAYVKHTGIDKKLVVDGSVRHCIMCSQELKRDVLLEQIPIRELREINEEIMEKKAKST